MPVSDDKCPNESYSTDMNLLQCLLVMTDVLMKVMLPEKHSVLYIWPRLCIRYITTIRLDPLASIPCIPFISAPSRLVDGSRWTDDEYEGQPSQRGSGRSSATLPSYSGQCPNQLC